MTLRCDDSMTDAELMDAYYRGSDLAFDLLHDRYEAKLCNWLTKLTRFDRARAEDHAQTAFVKACITKYSIAARFCPEQASFGAWIYRIAYNVFLAEQKSPKREASMEDVIIERAQAGQADLVGASGPAPLEHLLKNETSRALMACLQQLAEPARDLFLLLLEGSRQTDAAQIIGISDVRAFRIKTRTLPILRKCLDDKGVRGPLTS